MKACRHHATPAAEGMSPEEHAARMDVGALRRFYRHLLTFVLVNAGLAALNLATRPDRLWFLWVLAGWTVWLAVHAIGMFARSRWFGQEWEERQVRQRLARR